MIGETIEFDLCQKVNRVLARIFFTNGALKWQLKSARLSYGVDVKETFRIDLILKSNVSHIASVEIVK